jgi:hypothetical protein
MLERMNRLMESGSESTDMRREMYPVRGGSWAAAEQKLILAPRGRSDGDVLFFLR